MRRTVRVIAVVTSAFLGVGLGTLPALAAAPPLHEVFFDDPSFALPDIDCGTFTIRETSFHNRIDVITYFNDAGEPVRVRVHVSFDGVLTNLSTGETLADRAHFSNVFDLVEGTFTGTGVDFHYSIQHAGLIVANNGRLVIDDATGEVLFLAGPHDIFDAGSLAPICSALA